MAIFGLQASQAQPLYTFPEEHASTSPDVAPVHDHAAKHRATANDQIGFMAREAFYRDFREATDEHWTSGKTMDRVDFVWNGKNLSAYYDQQANLIGTTEQRSWEDLPEKARKDILKKYPGFTAHDVIFFEDNTFNETDMILYDNRFDDADNYFVQLMNGDREVVLQVSPEGYVSVFRERR